MPLLDNELVRRQNGQLEPRLHPLRVRWVFENLITADVGDLRCVFACSARALSDAIELRTLEEVLLGPRVKLTDADVSQHFSATLRDAALAAAKSRGVEAWLSPEGKSAMADALQEAAKKLAFATGLEVLGPFDVNLESQSHQQQQLHKVQRALAEQQAADQVEHLAKAAELLRKFQEVRTAAPELSAGTVLSQLNPTDQGQMLQSLLAASARQERAADLWVVAGPYLVRVDARQSGPPRTALFPLPPDLGPTRSVQPGNLDGERVLLVGMRGGFMIVRPGTSHEPVLYADPSVESQYGFSRVVYLGPARGFAACHGEAGIVHWTRDGTQRPTSATRSDRFLAQHLDGPPPLPSSYAGTATAITSRAPGPRNLQSLDDHRLIFSVGPTVWVMDGDDAFAFPPASAAEVIAIVAAGGSAIIVREEGTVSRLDVPSRSVMQTENRGMRIRSAGALPWLGGVRLLVAPDDGPVQCTGADDPLVTQYCSPHRGLRVVTGSADLVAGVSADRQRLVLWHTWDGRQPVAEVYLAGLTQHRIADVEFG